MKTLDIRIDGNYETGEHITMLCAMYLEIDNNKAIYIFDSNNAPIEHYVHYVSIVITHPYVMADSRVDNLSVFINLFKKKLLEEGFCEENEYGTIFAKEQADDRKIIGKRIADLRNKKGFSQRQLAELTGINYANICKIENGRYSVGFDVLSRIAEVFDMKIDFVNAE